MKRLISLLAITMMALSGLALTAGPGARATTPGTNGLIVFSGDRGEGIELFTIKEDGTALAQLTDLEGDAVGAEWSSDGERIAFGFEDATHAAIVTMNADGSGMTELTSTGFEGQPAFTPDGSQLVYECDCPPEGSGIFMMDVDGTDRRRLTTNPFENASDTDPNISPDGQTITFVRLKVEHELQALFAIDIDGTNLRRLTPYRLEVGVKHDWAPGGHRIVIIPYADHPRGQSPQVATIRPDGSHLRILTRAGVNQGALTGSYSPDGKWIVYRLENSDRERFRLFKIHPDGTGRSFIKEFPFSPFFIDWGSQPQS
jgi:Tol biopolymer transport system component